MSKQTKAGETKKSIIDKCLDEFIKNGIFETSVRDLANGLHMQSSGLYYYFKSKDDIIVACAEEAGIRMEEALLLPVLNCIREDNPPVEEQRTMMEEMIPLMQFFAQVCTIKRYREKIQPVMNRLKARHTEYSEEFARQLSCKPEEVAPYLYACVAVVANYMIFGEEVYYQEPFALIASAIRAFKEKNEAADEA